MGTFLKLLNTLRILVCLGLARMFGEYQHSGWNGDCNFARYRWCGKEWIVPTSPVNDRT